jgi:hypothetical protein
MKNENLPSMGGGDMREQLGDNPSVRPMTVRSGMCVRAAPGSRPVAEGAVRRLPGARRSWCNRGPA